MLRNCHVTLIAWQPQYRRGKEMRRSSTDDAARDRSWKRRLIDIISVVFQIVMVSTAVFCISVVSCRLCYRAWVPRSIVKEVVHFDFRETSPRAVIKLDSNQNQWSYLKTVKEKETVESQFPSLIRGVAYDLSAQIVFSKSPRNYNLGKIVLTTTLQDKSDESIAQSIRTVPITYRSYIITIVEELASFILHVFGYSGYSGTQDTTASLLTNFVEPSSPELATKTIQLELSTAEVDIHTAWIQIVPKMNKFTRFLFYHPIWSHIIGTVLFGLLQLVCIAMSSVIFLISKALKDPPAEIDISRNDGAFAHPVIELEEVPDNQRHALGRHRDSQSAGLRRRSSTSRETEPMIGLRSQSSTSFS